jgi:hypothetical protein
MMYHQARTPYNRQPYQPRPRDRRTSPISKSLLSTSLSTRKPPNMAGVLSSFPLDIPYDDTDMPIDQVDNAFFLGPNTIINKVKDQASVQTFPSSSNHLGYNNSFEKPPLASKLQQSEPASKDEPATKKGASQKDIAAAKAARKGRLTQ